MRFNQRKHLALYLYVEYSEIQFYRRLKKDPLYRTYKGRFCEAVAVHSLLLKKHKILKKNYHCIHGEVDIITSKEHLLIFIEVKAWDVYDQDAISLVITPAKLRRLSLCAAHFVRNEGKYIGVHARMCVRIDVMLVQLLRQRIVHYKGV